MNDHWNRFVGAISRWNGRFRHLQARRPVVMSLAYGALAVLIWVVFFGRVTTFRAAVPMALAYGGFYALWSMYLWRPGGMSRRQYERWCESVEQRSRPAVIPDGASPPGWYANPKRKNRAGYWTGADWV